METSSHAEDLVNLQARLQEEENKRKRWEVENIRRKHNYLPLIVNMLKILAEEGKLMPIYQAAKEKAKQRQEQLKAKEKSKA